MPFQRGTGRVARPAAEHRSRRKALIAKGLVVADNAQAVAEGAAEEQAAEALALEKLDLKFAIDSSGPCRKHVRITVPRADLDRILDSQVGDLVTSAEVPGFRPGHVPAALIRKRFKTELSERVKQQVLLKSLEQMAESEELDPINEPDLDVESIELPEDGDFTFEFDVEVRPEFKLPNYKGLKINRPVREISDADVEAYTEDFVEQYAQLIPVDEAAQAGDTVIVDVAFTHGGEPLREFKELSLQVRPTLRFNDAELKGFDQLMVGARAGDVRETDLTISPEADKVGMRNESVHAKFSVLDVKRMERPELNEEFFSRVGAKDGEDLRKQFRGMLQRQVAYQQRQAVRDQVLAQITESATWDLPEELLRKQTENAMRREMLELRQSGFTEAEVRAREAELRRNSLSTTRRNLKQHFILDRIAELEKVEVTADDIEMQIMLMAMQSGENPRRVRSRLIKSGLIENLEAQIRERKSVDVILESATFTDKPLPPVSERNVEGVNRWICSDISDTDVEAEESAAE